MIVTAVKETFGNSDAVFETFHSIERSVGFNTLRAHRVDVGYGLRSAGTENSQETDLFSVFFCHLLNKLHPTRTFHD
jgi:hypothetical protein